MKIILFVVMLVIGIIFAGQNDMNVTVRYYQFILEDVTLYSVILSSVLIGFVTGVIYSYIDGLKIKRAIKKERKMRRELEQELENLRTLPLASDTDIQDEEELLQETEDIISEID